MKVLSPEVAYCRAVTKSWEFLRIFFNILLLIPGMVVLWKTIAMQEQFSSDLEMPIDAYMIAHPLILVVFAIAFGIVANVFYCLGPYIEFLISARGYPLTGQKVRYALFVVGVLMSFGLIWMIWFSVKSGILFTLPLGAVVQGHLFTFR